MDYNIKSCFADVNSLDLNINSSVFEYNNANNGGVMYFSRSLKHNNANEIKLYNSIFSNNKADYFGGVIYSNYEKLQIVDTLNTTFKENHAYSGGGFYFNYNNNANHEILNLNDTKIEFVNNTSESHGNDYATDTYMILSLNDGIKGFNIKSGESYSLKFNVIDEYNQIIRDISKYYSNIILKISENDDQDSMNLDSSSVKKKFTGNICYFSNGIFFLF